MTPMQMNPGERSPMPRRIVAVLVAVVAALGVSLATAPAASADGGFTLGAVRNNCGIVTCSVYVSRSGTKSLDSFLDNKVLKYGRWGAETYTCGKLVAVPVVGAPLAVYCGFRFFQIDDVLDEAADKNKCFKVTYTRPVPPAVTTVTHISTNNGDLCKN